MLACSSKDLLRDLRASAVRCFFLASFICVHLCSSAAPCFAQQLTSGADFLKIDSGARSQGMGGAFTAVADDVNALTWNPAGLALLSHPEIGYLRMIYVSDIAYNFGGVAVPIRDGENTMGVGAAVINLGTPAFDSTLGLAPAVSAGDNAFSFSFAYRFKDIVAIGGTAKYILRGVAGFNAASFGGDAGVLVTPTDRLRIGVGVFHFGQSVQFVSEADPLPTTARLGLAYEVLKVPYHSFLVTVDNSFQFQSQSYQGGAGGEYWYDHTLALRGGFTGDAYQQHWTAGVGVNLKVAELDYAYAPLGTLGDTHRMSLIIRLGADTSGGLTEPAGFAAKSLDGAIALNWKPSGSKDVIGYNLYLRRPGTQTFARLTGQPISDTSIKFKNLRNGQTYTFQLASVSAAGRESSRAELAAVPGAGLPAPTPTPAPVYAPLPPAGLAVSPEGEGFRIAWDKAASSDITGYYLYLAGQAGKPPKKLSTKPLPDNKAVIKKVKAGQTYRFYVTALNQAGMESAPSPIVDGRPQEAPKVVFTPTATPTVAPLGPKPAAPSSAKAIPGDALVKFSWTEVPGVIGYHIYSSDDGANFRRLTKVPTTNLSATLNHLKNGKTYHLGVTSLAADGQESDRAVDSAMPVAEPQ